MREKNISARPANKADFRQSLRQTRAALKQDQTSCVIKETAAIQQVLTLLPIKKGLRIGLYAPFGSELNCFLLLPALSRRACTLCLPVVASDDMYFVEWNGQTPLYPDALGIPTPITPTTPAGARIPSENLSTIWPELLIVPCLGFTKSGYRLGYGRGFYDRWLAAADPKPTTIGIAFDQQEIDFEPEKHDYPLDYVVTPQHIFKGVTP